MAQQAPRGEAQDYYQSGPDAQQYDQSKYQQPPPQYGNNSYVSPNYAPQGEKQDFNQAFKLDKPKWNDWWAGLLVRSVHTRRDTAMRFRKDAAAGRLVS